MRSCDFSIRLRVGYILVSLVMIMEIGDTLLAYFDPIQHAFCNFCYIRSLMVLVLLIIGFVQISKGMKQEYPESKHSIKVGIALLVFNQILGIYVVYKFGGIEGILGMGTKNYAIWTTARIFIQLRGIFFIMQVIHTSRRKKILAAILAGVFIACTVNMLIMYPKIVDFYQDLGDFIEGEEEEEEGFYYYNYYVEESSEPTEDEILERYNEGKKPLFVHIIIKSILEMIIAIIFFSSFFFQRDDYDEYYGDSDNSDYY